MEQVIRDRPIVDRTADIGETHEGVGYISPFDLIASTEDISWAEITDRDSGELRYVSISQPSGWTVEREEGEISPCYFAYFQGLRLDVPCRTTFESMLATIVATHNSEAEDRGPTAVNLVEQWKSLTPNQRQVYVDSVRAAAERYEEKMASVKYSAN